MNVRRRQCPEFNRDDQAPLAEKDVARNETCDPNLA